MERKLDEESARRTPDDKDDKGRGEANGSFDVSWKEFRLRGSIKAAVLVVGAGAVILASAIVKLVSQLAEIFAQWKR